jgi:Photosynthesis system II assembly factor YCF48/Putative zinc-finger
MSEMSNALRQRLAAREDPRVHPDPDSLTAYLEQLLPAPERNQVLEHLAVCRQCREVVALSLPQEPVIEDVVAVAVARPVRRGWRAWFLGKPALGLVGSLAGLAIVATLVIELPRGSVEKQGGQPAPLTANNNNVPATPAPTGPEAKQAEIAPAADALSTVQDKEVHPASPVANSASGPASVQPEPRAAKAAPKATDSSVSSVGGPYVNTQMFVNDASNNVVTASNELPAAPAPRTTSDFQSNLPLSLSNNAQLTTADAPHQTQSSKPLRILNPAANLTRSGLTSVITLGRDAKQIFHRPAPAINPYGYGFTRSAMGGAGQFNPATEMGPAAEITAAAPVAAKDAAELEQSHALTARARSGTSAGKTEEFAYAGANKKTETAQSAWKVGDSKLLKLDDSGAWTEAAASEGIEFSVVSSHGSDIWAGGANAAMVHSHDGGATWERITLGSSATGTITSIEAGALKIQVKSSSGQNWSSPDGGKTWVLQD